MVPFIPQGPQVSPFDTNLANLAGFLQTLEAGFGTNVNALFFSKTLQAIREEMQTVQDGGRVVIVAFNARMGGPDCAQSKVEATKARDAKIVIHIVAVGQTTNLSIDPTGKPVTDLVCLEDIAKTTGGYFKHYEKADDAKAEVNWIADEVRQTLPVSLVE